MSENQSSPEEVVALEDTDEEESVYEGPSDDVPRSVNEAQDDLEEDEDGSA